jgi:hypothetical protein
LIFEAVKHLFLFWKGRNNTIGSYTGKKAEIPAPRQFDTAESYVGIQPIERQEALHRVRKVIKMNLPKGFQETIQYGMIGYVVPHTLYPNGYHVDPKEPLPFIALANQKGYIAFYHLGIYADKSLLDWFVKSYRELNIGKLDMGKSCIRFKKIDKIPYELIGELCSKLTVEDYIKIYEANKPNK